MSAFDPEGQEARTQLEVTQFALHLMIKLHFLGTGIATAYLVAAGAPLHVFSAVILVCIITFPFLPLMVGPLLGVLVHSAFRVPPKSTKRIICLLGWIFELSLVGWLLLFVLKQSWVRC